MFYENELNFLCDTLRKCHIRASVFSLNDPAAPIMEADPLVLMQSRVHEGKTIHQLIGTPEPKTLYRFTNRFSVCYLYLLLPHSPKASILFIGPYLAEPLTSRQILEIAEKIGLSPQNHRYLDEYYTGLPILAPGSQLVVMLHTFCERIWNSPSFSVVDVDREDFMSASPIGEHHRHDKSEDILVSMKTMETRYAFENELIRAVSLGQIHKETLLTAAITDQPFEKRNSDPIRNAKNYCIIMNTLLRKAAESGGVHPIYLDSVSSGFAHKIEQIPSLAESTSLMREMFRSYCRLVRKHSMRNLSPTVQKIVLLIESDLSADLSLQSLAKSQNISPGYLSTVFKKETGQTVSAYIRDKRIKHAIHLLSTTHLQIQTVALHCGIMDVQYFSKTFKKQTGKTPKEYRESLQ